MVVSTLTKTRFLFRWEFQRIWQTTNIIIKIWPRQHPSLRRFSTLDPIFSRPVFENSLLVREQLLRRLTVLPISTLLIKPINYRYTRSDHRMGINQIYLRESLWLKRCTETKQHLQKKTRRPECHINDVELFLESITWILHALREPGKQHSRMSHRRWKSDRPWSNRSRILSWVYQPEEKMQSIIINIQQTITR